MGYQAHRDALHLLAPLTRPASGSPSPFSRSIQSYQAQLTNQHAGLGSGWLVHVHLKNAHIRHPALVGHLRAGGGQGGQGRCKRHAIIEAWCE